MIPKKINILSIEYVVEVVSRESGEGATMRGSGTVGRVDFMSRRIILLDGDQPMDVLQSLIHEMVHAMLDAIGMHGDFSEQQVHTFAACFTDTLIRNGMVKTEVAP